jgi:hypothetical protein
VVTANKAGLQAVIDKVVIDTTPTAAVARLAGAAARPWSVQEVQVSRVCYREKVPGGRQIGDFCEYNTLACGAVNCRLHRGCPAVYTMGHGCRTRGEDVTSRNSP